MDCYLNLLGGVNNEHVDEVLLCSVHPVVERLQKKTRKTSVSGATPTLSDAVVHASELRLNSLTADSLGKC